MHKKHAMHVNRAIFCEYRYENGDVEMTLSKSHTGMDAKDVGGGRVVFGAGFAF